jgi:hypothetical protein
MNFEGNAEKDEPRKTYGRFFGNPSNAPDCGAIGREGKPFLSCKYGAIKRLQSGGAIKNAASNSVKRGLAIKLDSRNVCFAFGARA